MDATGIESSEVDAPGIEGSGMDATGIEGLRTAEYCRGC